MAGPLYPPCDPPTVALAEALDKTGDTEDTAGEAGPVEPACCGGWVDGVARAGEGGVGGVGGVGGAGGAGGAGEGAGEADMGAGGCACDAMAPDKATDATGAGAGARATGAAAGEAAVPGAEDEKEAGFSGSAGMARCPLGRKWKNRENENGSGSGINESCGREVSDAKPPGGHRRALGGSLLPGFSCKHCTIGRLAVFRHRWCRRGGWHVGACRGG